MVSIDDLLIGDLFQLRPYDVPKFAADSDARPFFSVGLSIILFVADCVASIHRKWRISLDRYRYQPSGIIAALPYHRLLPNSQRASRSFLSFSTLYAKVVLWLATLQPPTPTLTLISQTSLPCSHPSFPLLLLGGKNSL